MNPYAKLPLNESREKYMFKITREGDLISFAKTYDEISLKFDILKIERVELAITDYAFIASDYQRFKAFLMAVWYLVQHNRKIDAIVMLRKLDILADSGLKNCKYIADNMAMFSDFEEYYNCDVRED